MLLKGIGGCSCSSTQFTDSLSKSSSALFFDVDLFVCVGLHVLQPVRLSVHYLIWRFYEPEQQYKKTSLEIRLIFAPLFTPYLAQNLKKQIFEDIFKLANLNRSLCPGSFLKMLSL